MDYQGNIVILSDEEGNEVIFDYLMSIEYEQREYVILAPMEPSEDEPELEGDEVVILRVEGDEDGNDIYVTIEDDGELDKVFNAFIEITQGEEE